MPYGDNMMVLHLARKELLFQGIKKSYLAVLQKISFDAHIRSSQFSSPTPLSKK